MAPEGFADFFLASAGTGGAFVGLLFVAISIGPHRTFGDLNLAGGPQQPLAEATLLTLANGFVVSSIALIPEVNVGWFALVLGVAGAIVATRLAQLFARLHRHGPAPYAPWRHFLRIGSQSVVASMLFATEAVLGLLLILHPADRDTFRWLGVTIIVLPQSGLSGWLNPLQDPTVQRDKDVPSR